MSRIKLPALNALTAEQREQYNRFPANLTLGLLLTTCCTKGYLSLGASFPAGKIGNKDREMIILRVGALSNSPYERMQHYNMALQAGWSPEEISDIEQGIYPHAREAKILKFVDECVDKVKVSSATFSAVKEFYNEQQLAELTLLIGHYMMTARFLETLEIDLDTAATSWDNIAV